VFGVTNHVPLPLFELYITCYQKNDFKQTQMRTFTQYLTQFIAMIPDLERTWIWRKRRRRGDRSMSLCCCYWRRRSLIFLLRRRFRQVIPKQLLHFVTAIPQFILILGCCQTEPLSQTGGQQPWPIEGGGCRPRPFFAWLTGPDGENDACRSHWARGVSKSKLRGTVDQSCGHLCIPNNDNVIFHVRWWWWARPVGGHPV